MLGSCFYALEREQQQCVTITKILSDDDNPNSENSKNVPVKY